MPGLEFKASRIHNNEGLRIGDVRLCDSQFLNPPTPAPHPSKIFQGRSYMLSTCPTPTQPPILQDLPGQIIYCKWIEMDVRGPKHSGSNTQRNMIQWRHVCSQPTHPTHLLWLLKPLVVESGFFGCWTVVVESVALLGESGGLLYINLGCWIRLVVESGFVPIYIYIRRLIVCV